MTAKFRSLFINYVALLALAASSSVNAKTILIFGDSFSTGFGLEPEYSWVDMLRKSTLERHTVVNASYRGRYLTNSHVELQLALAEHQPDIVLIALGVNDGNQRIRLSKIREELHSMIENVVKTGAKVAMFSTPLPFSEGEIYAFDYENTFVAVSDDADIPHLSMLEQNFFSNQLNLQADNWHPSISGQKKIFDRAKRFLVKTYDLVIIDK